MPDAGGKEVQYWDAPVFISFLTATQPQRVGAFRQMLRNLQMPLGNFRVVLSTLVLVEVRPIDSDNPQHERIVSELFDTDRPYLQFYTVSQPIARRARELAAQFKQLTNPDAVHLATALHAGADVFLTYDGARDNKARRSGGLLQYDEQVGNPPLRIVEPEFDWGPLFRQAPPVPPSK